MSERMKQLLGSMCPTPLGEGQVIEMAHGGGGRRMQGLIHELIAPHFGEQACKHDGALLDSPPPGHRLALSTDSFVVTPLFFPGGDIGRLAVFGTVNDLAMCGALPKAISLSLIIEEGLPIDVLDAILASVAKACKEAGVAVVTGDTKVVQHGKGDGLFVNTTGVGWVPESLKIGPERVQERDSVVVSGDLGRHAVAIMSQRSGLAFDGPISSDCAPLSPMVQALLKDGLNPHCLRDITRGGLAAVLTEIIGNTKLDLHIDEGRLAQSPWVRGACEILGLYPIHLACEGRFVLFLEAEEAPRAVEILSTYEAGKDACIVGRVMQGRGRVRLLGPLGNERLLTLPAGEPLPRIC